MKLLRETLTNFKGIRSFTFEANGADISILGDNGTGKTTLLDGFLWVLLDKDSAGRKEFELKTLDARGKSIPMIDHSVELCIEQGGEKLTLRKTLSESWVKARGSAAAEFSGHRTAYEINGIPMQKKEFDAAIARLCDESALRLLTDPGYFPAKLPWQDRRRILLAICGEVTEAEVIAADGQLAELPSLLSGRTIEEYRKLMAVRKTVLNNELKTIPVRVDEATRALPDLGGINEETLAADIGAAQERLQALEAELLALTQGGALVGKKLRLQTIEAALLEERNRADAVRQQKSRDRHAVLNENLRLQEQLERRIDGARARLGEWTEAAERLEARLVKKREEWVRLDGEKYASTPSDTCPACGRRLPPEQVESARQKAQAAFHAERSHQLERISAEGTALAGRQAEIERQRQLLAASLPALADERQMLLDKNAALQAEIADATGESAAASARSVELEREQRQLQTELAALQENSGPECERLTAARDGARQTLADLSRSAAALGQRQLGLDRIRELQTGEQALADEYAELERRTFLTEEFIRTQVSLLESKINSRFRLARFRLFEQQVNGALNEVCEVLGPDGVPYNGGLNHAARINTGIDIINTLAQQYGFLAPIFVDNAEAVTQLIETPAQVIRLVVSEADKTLRVDGAAPVVEGAAVAAPVAAAGQSGPGF